jgi:pyruvate dehydrogenase E2 component (dihydrolipoamide acetyltransferase)
MLESAQSTARVTLIMEVDASRLVAFRSALVTEHADEWGFKPGYTPILAMLVSRALKRAPFMNARWVENRIEQHESVNMGIAMDTDRGLVVPVIRAIDRMGLRSICEEFIQQVAAVRQNTIAPDALQGGTFTLTNLGGYEVDAFTPIINPPETAILGIGRIAERPFVVNHQLTARHTMTLSLAFDHRLVDGAPAARFLQKIKQYTEEPGLLITL